MGGYGQKRAWDSNFSEWMNLAEFLHANGQSHYFLYCVPSATYYQNPIFNFGTRFHFFLRNVVYRFNFIGIINETWIFLLLFFSAFMLTMHFLPIRAKYPSYCHFETIYQRSMLWNDFSQCSRSEVVKKRTTKNVTFSKFLAIF